MTVRTHPVPAPRDELAARRAARAAHPANDGLPHAPAPAPDGSIQCPACGCPRWRTEYVTLTDGGRWPLEGVMVSSCDDVVWCVDCGHELLLPDHGRHR